MNYRISSPTPTRSTRLDIGLVDLERMERSLNQISPGIPRLNPDGKSSLSPRLIRSSISLDDIVNESGTSEREEMSLVQSKSARCSPVNRSPETKSDPNIIVNSYSNRTPSPDHKQARIKWRKSVMSAISRQNLETQDNESDNQL